MRIAEKRMWLKRSVSIGLMVMACLGCAEEDVVGVTPETLDPTDASDAADPSSESDPAAAQPCESGEAVSKVYIEVGSADFEPWRKVLTTYLDGYLSVEAMELDGMPESGSVVLSLTSFNEASPAETIGLSLTTRNGCRVYSVQGSPRQVDEPVNIGLGFATFELLRALGFAFWHPFEPYKPASITWPESLAMESSPRWPVRSFQIHTMHPIELADFLNGWGPEGLWDNTGFDAGFKEWELYLHWLVANRQNHVLWVLLWAEDWADFAESDERFRRLTRIVDAAHVYGLQVGVDVPIALHQQHSYQLLREQGELSDELAEIRTRIDKVMGAGFDFLATESGSSEFTHPEPARMLAWMDQMASHLDEAYDGAQAWMKVHIPAGLVAEGYADPVTGEDINFNFLTYYADDRLAVMPHTVQHYALDDPAPTYGNLDFSHMRTYLQSEVGRRPVIWHPETAYWVSFDIDVPLFLPTYAERRFHDLWILAEDEESGAMAGEGRMDGQSVFSSGYEWGYWLNDVVAARAAWDVHLETGDERLALKNLLEDVFKPFGAQRAALVDALLYWMDVQHQTLILGEVDGQRPDDIVKRNAQAYLSGTETWDDMAEIGQNVPLLPSIETQPVKKGLIDMRNPLDGGPGYTVEIDPLLNETELAFEQGFRALEDLLPQVDAGLRPWVSELVDAAEITYLRARQVHGLYDWVDADSDPFTTDRPERLVEAKQALDDAIEVVLRREANYRMPVEQIASWRPNPTAYDYTYLWTAHNLLLWWRDEGKAVQSPLSPCYLNHINAVQVGFGEGLYVDAAAFAADVIDEIPGVGSLAECLEAPEDEPLMPPPGLRP